MRVAANRYVLNVKDRGLLETLRQMGELDRLAGAAWFLISLSDSQGLEEDLERLREALNKNGFALPVLIDANEQEVYPVGKFVVIFSRSLSDVQVNEFARETRMRLAQERQPTTTQAIFEPQSLKTPILSILGALNKHALVKRAWPDKLSRRATGT